MRPMKKLPPDPERCAVPPRARARYLSALAVLLGAVLLSTALTRTALALENLNSFPHSALNIQTRSGSQHFDIWVADTAARSEQGLMFVRSLPADRGML